MTESSSEPTATPVFDAVVAQIRRHGPRPFDEVMRLALYDPDHGFYAAGGAAGRRGDFVTSVEVGPLFGAVVARALDAWWYELGCPDPFVVVEAAAGTGMLARTVLQGGPACAPALTYVMVEQSEALRERQGDHLELTAASHALPPRDDAEPAEGPATGPRFVSLPDLPVGPFTGVVFANELLDNLPVRLVEFRAGEGWCEVRVGVTDDEEQLVEFVVPAAAPLAELAARLVPEPADRARIPLQLDAHAWVRRAFEVLERGRIVLIDYVDTTASLATRPATEWLRTYRRQTRGDMPLVDLGQQDITCEVAIDQLERLRPGLVVETQAAFLRRFGVDELVDEGRRTWQERGHIGDLAAMRARSRINEAAALLDPEGLGAFRVFGWRV